MADELFHVVFRGDIADGFALADVKARFAQLFKLDPARVDAYFAGKPTALKKDCDRATAEKFRGALQQIGAVAEIRPANPAAAAPAPQPAAQPAAQTAAAKPAVPVAPAAPAAAVAPVAANPWSLSPEGSTLIRPDEIIAPPPVEVSIEHISVVKRNPFAADAEPPLEADRDVAPPALDLSAYEVAAAGVALAEYEEFVPLPLDLSALSLSEVGADLLKPEERHEAAPVQVDTSELSLAPPGGDLGEIQPPPPPPPPSTEHLSVQK